MTREARSCRGYAAYLGWQLLGRRNRFKPRPVSALQDLTGQAVGVHVDEVLCSVLCMHLHALNGTQWFCPICFSRLLEQVAIDWVS